MTVTNVTLEVDINSGNAALVDDPHLELARILKGIVKEIERQSTHGNGVYDLNGQRVGNWYLEIEEEIEDEEEDEPEEEDASYQEYERPAGIDLD